jgi:hypothetical protein
MGDISVFLFLQSNYCVADRCPFPTSIFTLHSRSTLPFSQSDVSVDPRFYCHLRYVEGHPLSRSFLPYLITFASFLPGNLQSQLGTAP